MHFAQQSLNIAIFGLSLKVLSEIKLVIENLLPKDTLINWTNIADPKLQVLMVNDMFFDAPSIQKLIKNQNIRLLRLITHATKHGKIEDNILYLPLSDTNSLKNWLSEEPITTEVQSSNSAHIQTEISSQDLYMIVQEVLNPENGNIQVFDQHGILAMVDPRNQWVWVSRDKITHKTDDSLNTVYATMNDRHAFNDIQRQDLKNWLWNLLWRSPTFHHFVKAQDCFYLKQWPQPESKQDRYDIMRMSACFAQGANIITVAERLGLSVDRVIQFVSSARAVGMGTIIHKNQVKYPAQQASSEDSGLMKKFFGKLRRRLGL
ncbi:hypothetical protein [Acinetobacter sp. MB5]|uniref:hypothetical protein n=1 Tax=Acinetobacter sp. MB5 TaxID=2069438 RepID=UPI000DCFA499|nr:hypothetical protein [Acinetobacter sp. MB5]